MNTTISFQQSARLTKWIPRAAAAISLLACWLANHPYIGIAHDARLYSVQALSRILPGQFATDLYFLHGSQESFTVFSRLWAPWIGRWGIGNTAIALLMVTHALWVWGAVRLVRVLFPHRTDRYLALAGLFVLPPEYGGLSIFRYGEGFLTPRVVVEAIILHALAWTAAGRGALALVAVSFSALLHPLSAVTGALVIWFRLCLDNWRWLLLGLGAAIAAVVLAFAGVPPLDLLLKSFDPEWMRIAQSRNAYAFPTEWSWTDWNRVGLHFATIAIAAVWIRGEARRFIQALLLASAATLLAALIGTDVLRNILISQLQLWRGLWLISALANVAVGFLISCLWRESPHRIPAISIIAAAWCWTPFPEVSVAFLLAGAGLFIWMWSRPGAALPAPIQWTICLATGLTAGCIAIVDRHIRTNFVHTYHGRFKELVLGIEAIGILEWFILGLFVFAWTRRVNSWKPAVSLGLAAGACVLSLICWDRRGYWREWIETHDRSAVPFDRTLRQNEQVLWLDGATETWILLHRPSYFSAAQGSGVLLSRGTALEYSTRATALAHLDPRDNMSLFPKVRVLGPPPVVTDETLTYTCRSIEGLDSIISATEVPGRATMVWHAPVSKVILRWSGKEWFADTEKNYYLYRCSDFRLTKMAKRSTGAN